MNPRGVIIAAPASGSGKTVLTLGCLRALAGRASAGREVAGAKAGPDYIDPAFHAAACRKPCFNLDPWAMRIETIAALIADTKAEIILCEGVMGLFDGGYGCSTADLAAMTGWPVVLVVDVRGQGASTAALIQGFARHRHDVAIAGVIFNRVASAPHEAAIREAMAQNCPEIPILGFVPRDQNLATPERHLGLVQAREIASLEAFLDHASAVVSSCVDLEKLLSLAMPARLNPGNADHSPMQTLGQRIAVARDDAFAFCYEATIAGWRQQGAEISFFSPLAGEYPDSSCDAIYLPGGYPELHAGKIARSPALPGLRAAAARGAAIYGECGGYMVLGSRLEDASGSRHEMAGLLPLETSFARRKLHLGYREIETAQDSPLGAAGARFRGHEFHYATTLSEGPGTPLFRCRDLSGAQIAPAGIITGRILGSFVHLVDRAL